jgi:hypothetical protein
MDSEPVQRVIKLHFWGKWDSTVDCQREVLSGIVAETIPHHCLITFSVHETYMSFCVVPVLLCC